MLKEASITGLFRTLLIIVGVIALLRFLGRLMIAKRNMDAERVMSAEQRSAEKTKRESQHKFGKTSIIKDVSKSKTPTNYGDVEDVDFEEME
jgi:hypothetical protein